MLHLSVNAWPCDTWKLLQQVTDQLEDGRGGILTHAIDPEIATLTVTAEAHFDQGVWLPPYRRVNGYPALAGSALMADPQVTRLDFIGWHGSPQDAL